LVFLIEQPRVHRSPRPPDTSPAIPPCVPPASKLLGAPGSRLRPPSLRSWFCGSTKLPDGFVVNHRKPRVQTPVVSRYHAPVLVHDFVLLFFSPCGPHLITFGHRVHRAKPTCLSTPRGPTRLRPLVSALHLHHRKSSRNMHLQYSTKSQSIPHCQSLITARSDHQPVLGRTGPQQCIWWWDAWLIILFVWLRSDNIIRLQCGYALSNYDRGGGVLITSLYIYY
jgi:hypothetical protein